MRVQTRTSPGLAARSYCTAVRNPKPPLLRAALSTVHQGCLTSQNGTLLSATWHLGHHQAPDLSSNMFIDWKEKWRQQTITQPVFILCLEWVQGSNVWVYVNLSATLEEFLSPHALVCLHYTQLTFSRAQLRSWGRLLLYIGFTLFNFKKCTVLCVWVICLHVCLHTVCVPHARGGHFQDPLELELQKVVATLWVWELNPGLPKERLLLLITLASLQSLYRKF